MNSFPIYQADAFTSKVFSGNPASVCPLTTWLPEEVLQQIAFENNQPETAFVVPYKEDFQIRWFTPTMEVDLCGHATLAAAHIFYEQLGYRSEMIRFFSKSGWLTVTRAENQQLTLDFPADTPSPVEKVPQAIWDGFGISSGKVYKGKFDYMVEVETEDIVAKLSPDLAKLSTLDSREAIITAKGKTADFVSRCFFPQSGIDEDPVTGSAHCLLTAYWYQQTGRTQFKAAQLSARRGEMDCEIKGDRVLMTGKARTYLKGEIYI
jgi:PhzF family phenazine biosynthesis protein